MSNNKYTTPWAIKSYQGEYYISQAVLLDDSQGTACVCLDLSSKKVEIHPDDIKYIKEWYTVPKTYLKVELEITTRVPSIEDRKLEQTLNTIDFVNKYNKKLGDYIAKVNGLD